MKQSICYLYEYENYKQTKNVGFVKTSFYKNKVTFQIHGKGLECNKFMDLEMFLFTEGENTYSVDRVGYVEGNQGMVNYIVSVDTIDAETLAQYDGVLLEAKNKRRYVASWKKKEVRLEVLLAQEKPEEADIMLAETSEDSCENECVHGYEVWKEHDESWESQELCEDEEPCVGEGPCESTESCEQEAPCECGFMEEIPDSRSGCVCDLETGNEFQRIDRHGISELPQREWRLASNNFLLHGISNYKHLMLIRIETKLYLGIPGVYHHKEEAAAKSFGFPYFQKVSGETLGLSEGEYTAEEFGYWCRPVTERRGRNYKNYGEVDTRRGA